MIEIFGIKSRLYRIAFLHIPSLMQFAALDMLFTLICQSSLLVTKGFTIQTIIESYSNDPTFS